MELDLFGEEIKEDVVLRTEFAEPPFTLLDARKGDWQNRKKKWLKLGIKGEVGRNAPSIHIDTSSYDKSKGESTQTDYTSVFDPYLCEVIYKWFCPDEAKILDPFAGGSVRGIVASELGHSYFGIDIRQEQIDSNKEQAEKICTKQQPFYECGDSNKVLNKWADDWFDLVFSCPPYADLEKYSDLEGDISNMPYDKFLVAYRSIILKACEKLKKGGYAVFVVGEVRGKDGAYYGFIPDTIKAFTDCGMKFYNEAILATPVGSGSMRAMGNMKTKKLVKTHQNILVFQK